MTDLQIILLLIGLLVIVGVILFNWWQERKMHREASRFVAPERDVLMDEEFHIDTDAAILREEIGEDVEDIVARYEFRDKHPVTETTAELEEYEQDIASRMHTDADYVEDAPDMYEEDALPFTELTPQPPVPEVDAEEAELLDEAGFDDVVAEADKPDEVVAPVSLPDTIYLQIDLPVLLYLSSPSKGGKLREAFLSFADVDKAIYAYGQTADKQWRLLTRDEEATDFNLVACSLQLADRSGPITRETLARFQSGVDEIAHAFNAQIEWHGHLDPVKYANELDQFCIEVDKLVSLHIVNGSSGPFTGTKFRGLAEAGGLTLGDDGAFHYDADGTRLFSLVNQDNNPFNVEMLRNVVLRGVILQLDIPRVRNCTEAFNQMILVAKQMSGSLNATLVDDNQRPLGDLQIDKIRQQLKVIHAQMVARGVLPGSACALRLFS